MAHTTNLPQTLARLVSATNDHDIDGLVGCFASDYALVMPNHPARDFTGTEQVRRNWTQLFSHIPDLSVAITGAARDVSDPEAWWTEWELRGTRTDGSPHLMRGIMIMTLGSEPDDRIRANRFYLESVEGPTSLDNDAFLAELTRPGSRP